MFVRLSSTAPSVLIHLPSLHVPPPPPASVHPLPTQLLVAFTVPRPKSFPSDFLPLLKRLASLPSLNFCRTMAILYAPSTPESSGRQGKGTWLALSSCGHHGTSPGSLCHHLVPKPGRQALSVDLPSGGHRNCRFASAGIVPSLPLTQSVALPPMLQDP